MSESPIGQPAGRYMRYADGGEFFMASERMSFETELSALRENLARIKACSPEYFAALDKLSTHLAEGISRDLDLPPAILSEAVLRVLSGTAGLIKMVGPTGYVNVVAMTAAKIGGHIE